MNNLPTELLCHILSFYDNENLNIIYVSTYFYNLLGETKISIYYFNRLSAKLKLFNKLNRLYINIREPQSRIDIHDALRDIKLYVINNKIEFAYIKFILKYYFVGFNDPLIYKIHNYNNSFDVRPKIIVENYRTEQIIGLSWNINRTVQIIGKGIRINEHNMNNNTIKIKTKKLLDDNKNKIKKNYNQNCKQRKY